MYFGLPGQQSSLQRLAPTQGQSGVGYRQPLPAERTLQPRPAQGRLAWPGGSTSIVPIAGTRPQGKPRLHWPSARSMTLSCSTLAASAIACRSTRRGEALLLAGSGQACCRCTRAALRRRQPRWQVRTSCRLSLPASPCCDAAIAAWRKVGGHALAACSPFGLWCSPLFLCMRALAAQSQHPADLSCCHATQLQPTRAALLDPPPFDPSKLSVEYLPGTSSGSRTLTGRRYTLTHNDVTGSLQLAIGVAPSAVWCMLGNDGWRKNGGRFHNA